ncbi:MAG: endo alpha,4 polygalactosaminidase, partial [Conexibacter sp.]|nr:endo alpha,4 polygalactosaminidase [Conexibacter sp.]
PAPAASSAPGGRWTPAPRTTWQWQLSGTIDQSVAADMYDVDLFDTPAATVASLHAQGRHVVCYLDAGTYEPGRPDSGSIPAAVQGSGVDGWPGERWLDVRRLDVLGPILERRLDLCRSKGFDGVEPDNIDGYSNSSGFPLSAADQLAFNRFIAAAAHARGLSVGLKNDLDQAATLQPDFDWALNEQCYQYGECSALQPFAKAGKAVFIAEYDVDPSAFCAQAAASGYSAIRKHLALDAWRQAC